jgi:hypothetical protein
VLELGDFMEIRRRLQVDDLLNREIGASLHRGPLSLDPPTGLAEVVVAAGDLDCWAGRML